VSNQQLIDALVASQKTMLDQMVTNGRLTQAQADKWLDWYKQVAALQLTEPYGGFGFGGMRGGPGKMREFGGMRGRGHWENSNPQSPTRRHKTGRVNDPPGASAQRRLARVNQRAGYSPLSVYLEQSASAKDHPH